MAKQLNVNLAFTADTSKAKSQLQDLQNQLSKLTSAPAQQLNLKWTEEIQEATTAAMELKTHLQNATNVQTGSLDFTKLNSSIKQSGKSLSDYGRQLQNLGPAGQQAFMSLASAVAQSEIPIRRSNAALREMMTTLKNTARWQLSSSMLHGFMGAVQGAYRYAQDLNASLNDIRIVTGQNIEQMAKFAESANKAARTLSTTTTDYTNASLIYYQQGLSDAEVAKRTEVTVKMANASGQSAQIVSDQMTAVWNNFYDGSKSLEYYADVMTALGAATASSADEIAGGLEKFAAIGDTIGLSYEYAASALATITSNTRQSEEVVGTALKTIFARIQGLNLGETLDDGTTLNKYSEALQKVGISIFEQSGEIKTMDNILDEMASKWGTLAKDQQIALAQTVAGVRQYTQLVALMDNWNNGDSDSMMANLDTSYNATGTLQKQADIYAESWEAAQDRVRAAAEGIFSSLIDENFFIGILNAFEGILSYVDKTIDSLGGLKGVLSTVGVLMTKVFSDQMAQGLRNMAHNIYMSTEGGRKAVADEKIGQMRQMREDMSLGQKGIGSEVGNVANKQFEQQLLLQERLMLNSQNMSESEIANAQQLLDLRKQIGDEVVKAKQAEIDAREKISKARDQAFVDMGAEADNNDGILGIETTGRFDELQAKLKMVGMAIGDTKQALQSMGDTMDGELDTTAISKITDAFRHGLGSQLGMSKKEIKNFFKDIEQGGETANAALKKLMDRLQGKSGGIQGAMNKELGVGKSAAREMAQGYEQMSSSAYRYKAAAERAAEAQKLVEKRIKEAKGVIKDWANSIVSGAQAVMSFVSIVNSAKGAIDALTNPDLSGWEKFFAVLQSGAMIVTMTVSMFNSLMQAKKNWEAGTLKNAAATLIEAAATTLSTKANEKNARAQMKKAAGHEKDANGALKDAAATKLESEVTENSNNKQLKSNKKLSDSFKQLKTSGGEWFKAYKTQIGGTLLIAAAVATVVGTISWAVNQYNEAAREAENAAAAAEQLSEQYGNAKTNYENFNNTVSGYTDAVTSMEQLTKGTVEYNEAMLKANEYAMDLINKYDLIGKYSIKDGLIVFDDGVLEEARMKALDDLGKAQASQYMGQMAASHFAGQANQTSFNRKINTSSDNGQNAKNTGATTAAGGIAGGLAATGGAMLAGATIGSTVPIVGTIIGAVVGLLAGAITTAVVGAESEKEDKTLDSLTKYVEENGNGVFAAKDVTEFKQMLSKTEIDVNDDSLMQALYSNRDALQELTAAEVARLQKEEANWEAGFAAYNMSNANYTGLAVGQGFLNEQSSNYREENIEKVRSEVDKLWSGSNDDFWAQYLKYVYNQENVDVGNTSGENVRIRNLGGKGVTVEKMNAEGVWEVAGEKNGLDEDVAAEQLVNAMLLEEASEKMDLGTLHELTTNLINAGLALEEDSALMDSVLAQYAEGGPIDLSNYSYRDVTSIDTSKMQDSDFQAAVNTAIQNYKDGLSEVERALIEEGYNGLVGQNWTVQVDENSAVDSAINSARTALDAAQSYIDAHQLTTTLQVKDKLVSSLESGDMATFKELYNKSSFSKTMSYENAIAMGTDELIQWIQNGGQDLSDAFNTTQQALGDNTAAINAQNKLIAEAKADAYGEDGQADGVGGSEQVYLEAVEAEEEAQVYSHEGVLDATGWTGRQNMGVNIERTGFDYVSTTNASGTEIIDIGATLGQWDTLFAGYLGADSPLYAAYSQFTQDALDYSNADHESQDWYDASERMTQSWASLVDVMVDNALASGDWDAYREANGEEATRDMLRENYNMALQEDTYGNWNAPNFHLGDSIISTILGSVFAAGENGYGQTNYLNAVANRQTAEDDFRADETSAGETGAGEKNLENLEAERTGMLEDLHVQQALMKEEVSKYGLDPEVYEEMKRQIASTNEELEGQEGILHELAVAQLRAERGAKKMAEKQKDWKKAIESSNGEGAEYLETVVDIRDAYADVFDLDPTMAENLSSEFLTSETNMNLMTEALNGNEEAWDDWKLAVADALITDEMETKVTGLVDTTLNGVLQQIAEFNFEENGIEVGASVEDTDFWSALSAMQIGSAEAAAAISAALSSMGVDAKIVKHTVHQSGETRTWNTSGQMIDANGDVVDVDAQALMESDPVTSTYYTLEGATYNGKGVTPPSGGNNSGSGGGGGGSKPKKAKTVKKTDVVDRYKEVDDKLDDIADKMDDASKAADRLWGPARLKAMKDVNSALKEEIEGLKKKRQEAAKYDENGNLVGGYLKEDKDALKTTIQTEAGVNITDADFDDKGNFTKYDEVLNPLFAELDAAIKAANADGDATEEEQEKIDKIQERIDKVKEAIGQYDETKELVEDLDNNIQDKIYEWQDNNYTQLNYELEFKLEIEDSNLELVEYYLGKIENDIYATAEAFDHMNSLVDTYTNKLSLQEEHVKKLEQDYLAGKISLNDYKEGLRESQSAIIENLEALQQQKEAMQDYYGNVMSMALEEIALYTDEMDELNSVLDHYSNILELVGKQEDYATKGKVLSAKATNLRNEMQVQQKLYEDTSKEADDFAKKMASVSKQAEEYQKAKQKYAQAQIEGDANAMEQWAAVMAEYQDEANAYDTYKKNWQAAQDAANEAQDAMLSKTEEWAEAMKAVIENDLADLAKTMEETLTGGTSFDELLASMERRSSLQEEYLTTTNQIYETNKLMRQAQQEIDKTSNSAAKRRLQNFITETEQMQNQTKLSQYELDIQQAKYDLLLAEIALEEAQSAKSTVRLSRDSEGNFGYVYTADQEAVSNAEQELADKQNSLYNIGLEGANGYSQKYAETMQEAQDAITELTEMWMNGEIESEEEFQRRRAEIQDYYYEKLKQYSSLYQVALTTDTNVIADAWSTDFNDMIYQTDDWKTAVDGYFEGAAQSMSEWADVCSTVLEESALDDVDKKVAEITTKSNELKTTLIGEDGESGVVGAMMSEVEAAGKLSDAYIGIQNQIDATIKKYEEMMGVINEEYTNENTPEVDPGIEPEPEPEEPAPEPEPEPEVAGPAYHTGTLSFSGNGASRVWTDSAGNTYNYGSEEATKMQRAFNKAYGANGGYKGDYWQGWTNSGGKLDASVLHEKYGLATGGYTGDWEGPYGKLAFLHQKELVLNAGDTENFLQAMDILDKIVSAIDLYSMNSQLGGALSSPTLGHMGGSGDILEQQVHIEASFPGVQDRNEIEEAFNTLINRASQYANRK